MLLIVKRLGLKIVGERSPFLLPRWHTLGMESVLVIAVGLAAAIAAFYCGRSLGGRAGTDALRDAERRAGEATQAAGAELAVARSRADASARQLTEAAEREAGLRDRYTETMEALRRAEIEAARLATELKSERAAGLERIEAARAAAEERRADFDRAQSALSLHFKDVAAEILEDKTKRFTEHNRLNMEQLLTPLREKLGEFQEKVENLQQDGLVGRTELKTQIEQLRGLNEKLSTDANNLVKALKNSSKQQGDWGEVLLVGMLESAGLRAGAEYRVQETFAREEGRHVRPDIILNLPDDKHLVIDSKASLVSYAEYCACEDEATRKPLLERHARSVRDHIDGLSKKSYQSLHQLRSLDFVVMFVPIEAAYLLALAHDESLWQRAWSKDLLLVSPGTLFPVIRTIAHIWQQERQTKNVEEIVRQGGALYDKVAMFAETFEDVGKKIDGVQTAYEKAFGQLASGKGHVLSRIENLRRLGVRATRQMPRKLTESVEDLDPAGEAPGDESLDTRRLDTV